MTAPDFLPESELDEHIEGIRIASNSVGIAVAVVYGTQVVYARGFGLRAVGQGSRIDSNTLFQVGSTTKAFTATALGLLVEDGLLAWDDPVIEYLPDLQLHDPWLTRNLSVRDTVTHRSGIVGNLYPFLAVANADEAIRQLRHVKAEAAFRDSYCYSNLMYAVAGKVLERVSGMTWGEFVQRRLFNPLNMTRSRTSPYELWDRSCVTSAFFGSAAVDRPTLEDARDPNVALPHCWDGDAQISQPWRSYDMAAAAGALISSVADMGRWLVLHLNEGSFEGKQLLRRQAMRELHAIQNLRTEDQRSPVDPVTEYYASGWRPAQFLGATRLSHGGGMIGFPSYVALLLERKIGVVVLSNGPMLMREGIPEYLPHKSIAFRVFERLVGAPSRDWPEFCRSGCRKLLDDARGRELMLTQARLQNVPSSLPLERYTGTYEDREGQCGQVSVTLVTASPESVALAVASRETATLQVGFPGAGGFRARLEHWHGDLFRIRAEPAVAQVLDPQFAVFVVDALGRAGAVTLFGATYHRLL